MEAWLPAIAEGLDQTVPLPEIGAVLRLGDVYRRLRFAESG